MKKLSFLIVPDSFKDCLPATDVGENIAKGIKSVFSDAEIKIIPIADGGEGTVESIIRATGGKIIQTKVKDPLGKITNSFFGVIDSGETAIIEMAAASGIEKLSIKERNAWITSTFGTGQLIKYALDYGCSKIIIGLGGSATNDAGVGMAKALGVKFYDTRGDEIDEGGGGLNNLETIDSSGLDRRIAKTEIIAATDVNSFLIGPLGASIVFGRQKGATDKMIDLLENNMIHFSEVIKKHYRININQIVGGGAAGGLGAGLKVFLDAKISSGFDTISQLIGLENRIRYCDIVITAEGKVDDQTDAGKVPMGVGQLAKKYKKSVFLFTGYSSESTQVLCNNGITSIVPITRKPILLDEALLQAPAWLKKSAEELCKILKVGSQL